MRVVLMYVLAKFGNNLRVLTMWLSSANLQRQLTIIGKRERMTGTHVKSYSMRASSVQQMEEGMYIMLAVVAYLPSKVLAISVVAVCSLIPVQALSLPIGVTLAHRGNPCTSGGCLLNRANTCPSGHCLHFGATLPIVTSYHTQATTKTKCVQSMMPFEPCLGGCGVRPGTTCPLSHTSANL